MRVLIWRKYKGRAPEIWADKLTLKEAKQKLSDLYLNAIELFYEELNDGDGISGDKKQLTICNTEYFIEKDTRL